MDDGSTFAGNTRDAGELVKAAERLVLGAPDEFGADRAARVLHLLELVERATPGGAPLHAQLDTVRKWLAVIQRPGDHVRFGGTAHIRSHLAGQLGRARAAVDDYRRETT
jgi:hypothetical protein